MVDQLDTRVRTLDGVVVVVVVIVIAIGHAAPRPCGRAAVRAMAEGERMRQQYRAMVQRVKYRQDPPALPLDVRTGLCWSGSELAVADRLSLRVRLIA